MSQPYQSPALSSSPETQTYDLGHHTLEISEQGVELANQSLALHLDTSEAYHLLLALQSLFPAV